MDAGWTWAGDSGADKLAAIVCINVLHISPWAVAENLIAGAGRFLRTGGHMLLYGPYKRNGEHTAPSNAAFDASLRARNPGWGVRDIADVTALAETSKLTCAAITPMPSNNFVLAFQRHA